MEATAAVEDKRPALFPPALRDFVKRASAGRVMEVEVSNGQIRAPEDQPNWWLIANKGAVYSVVYNSRWVVFAGVTAYCVGIRIGDHMLWCPVYNRRQAGDETTPDRPNAVQDIFGTDLPEPRNDLLLLFLAILVRGVSGDLVASWFPRVQAVALNIPPGAPSATAEYDGYGRNIQRSSTDSASEDGDRSGDYVPGHSAGHARSGATLSAGADHLNGEWSGPLTDCPTHHVLVGERISNGFHGDVYRGTLLENGLPLAPVAVKVSDQPEALLTEFNCYQQLQQKMNTYLPRCYGLCVVRETAFLVTALVKDRCKERQLDKAERGAAYAALKKMHESGYRHNDVVDQTSGVIRNVLWTDGGRPVLIDLVTATEHTCRRKCDELACFQKALCISNHELTIWASSKSFGIEMKENAGSLRLKRANDNLETKQIEWSLEWRRWMDVRKPNDLGADFAAQSIDAEVRLTAANTLVNEGQIHDDRKTRPGEKCQ
ncbi:hypothetical protein K438DRAFT_1753318 [Mycena galopus ATCC 62051]|nr:hypothetical protein K438DRAFT_1753318 [Mycena galopus ATCC 62051]